MCGTDDGYRIYNTDPLKENAREGTKSICIVILYRFVQYESIKDYT